MFNKSKKLWVTSDTHYSHTNICRGVSKWDGTSYEQTRLYDTLEEMNDRIVNNINHLVKENDILLHLGDWSFGGIDKISEFRNRLNVKEIHLILGNHDDNIKKNKQNTKELFTSVQDYLEFEYKSFNFVCNHKPLITWNNIDLGWIFLFGHLHLPHEEIIQLGRSLEVGIEGNFMYPYEMDDIIEIVKNREINENIQRPHH